MFMSKRFLDIYPKKKIVTVEGDDGLFRKKNGEIVDGDIPKTKIGVMRRTLKVLESMKFPIYNTNARGSGKRKNITRGKKKKRVQAFTLGLTYHWGKGMAPAQKNRSYMYLLKLLHKLISFKKYKYTTIQINKNCQTSWHFDKNNVGKSYCLALGDFEKGGIDIRKDKTFDKITKKIQCSDKYVTLNNRNKFVYYDGKMEHRTASKRGGDRYAIIWFKHVQAFKDWDLYKKYKKP